MVHSSSRRRMLVRIVTVALPPLLFLTGLLALGQAQAPSPKGSKKPIPEEVEEPIKPRAKVPLRVGEDDDLIAFLGQIPPRRRASAIKAALRSGGMSLNQAEVDNPDDELLSALDDFLK